MVSTACRQYREAVTANGGHLRNISAFSARWRAERWKKQRRKNKGGKTKMRKLWGENGIVG